MHWLVENHNYPLIINTALQSDFNTNLDLQNAIISYC